MAFSSHSSSSLLFAVSLRICCFTGEDCARQEGQRTGFPSVNANLEDSTVDSCGSAQHGKINVLFIIETILQFLKKAFKNEYFIFFWTVDDRQGEEK